MGMLSDDTRRVLPVRRPAPCEPVRLSVVPLVVTTFAVVAAVVLLVFGAPVLVVVSAAAVAVATLSITARRAAVNLAYGATLRLVQPYQPGERIRLTHTDCGPTVVAAVVRIGWFNTTLATDDGILVVTNRRMLQGA